MRRTTLRELTEESGGYYIRPSGNGCLVRWPDGLGGDVVRETRETLQREADFQEYVDQSTALEAMTGEII